MLEIGSQITFKDENSKKQCGTVMLTHTKTNKKGTYLLLLVHCNKKVYLISRKLIPTQKKNSL